MIAEEIDSGKPRIKLYTDDNGNFKGDALIVFFRGESVELAIQLLDDTELRLGDGSKMRVTVADFSYKSQKDAPAKSSMKDKKKIIKKTQKLNKYVVCLVHAEELADTEAANWPTGTTMIRRFCMELAIDGTKW